MEGLFHNQLDSTLLIGGGWFAFLNSNNTGNRYRIINWNFTMKINIIQKPEIERIIKQTINLKPLWDELAFLRKYKVKSEENFRAIEKKLKQLEMEVYNYGNK